jgi:hypothetical protein
MAKKAPSEGDRIDLGGKIPQFDAFASFAYKELVRGELEWIKVADKEALTLDDIQYSTKAEIHAFQVKWSNLVKPEPFSYVDLKNILPELFEGWKAQKLKNTGGLKKLKVHLLSNRPPSVGDDIKDGVTKIGTCADFLREVWANIKHKKPVPAKWNNTLNEFKSKVTAHANEWDEFVESCEINLAFIPDEFGTSAVPTTKNDHLVKLSRFLLEKVIDKKNRLILLLRILLNNWAGKGFFQLFLIMNLLLTLTAINPFQRRLKC